MTTTTRPKTTRQGDSKYELYRVLVWPDSVSYLYGMLTESYSPWMAGVPLIVFRNEIMAILDPRCVIETANTGQLVYTPPGADVTWVRGHPDEAGHHHGADLWQPHPLPSQHAGQEKRHHVVMTTAPKPPRTAARTEPARPPYGGGHNTFTHPQSSQPRRIQPARRQPTRIQPARRQPARTQIDPHIVNWYNSLASKRQIRQAQTRAFLHGLARAEAAERQREATIIGLPTAWPLLLQKGSQ